MNKLSTTVAFLEHELSEIRLILERKTGVLIQTPTEQLSEIVAEHLDAEVARPQIHIGWLGLVAANPLEYLLEFGLDLGFILRAACERTRLKHGRVIRKKGSEAIPFEIVESLYKLRERLSNLGFGRSGLCHGGICQQKQQT